MSAAPQFAPFELTEPIVAERVTLRSMTLDDLDDVVAYDSREDVVRYQMHEPRGAEELAPKLVEWGAATRLSADGDYLHLAIDLDGRVIGHIYFSVVSVESLQGEIGWALHPDFFGKGYASEAAGAMLDLGFGTLGLHRVRANLDPRNDASVALCLRLGMRHEAHFVQDLWFKGEWGDSGIYAILADEWAARRE